MTEIWPAAAVLRLTSSDVRFDERGKANMALLRKVFGAHQVQQPSTRVMSLCCTPLYL